MGSAFENIEPAAELEMNKMIKGFMEDTFEKKVNLSIGGTN